MAIDLDAYFARIHYGGAAEPTMATLDALLSAHTRAIPFENLDVLLGRTIRLDDEGLQQKLVRDRRGGYCFEQNGLFLAVLQQIGFDAVPFSARVRVGRPRDYTPARTHLFVRVEIEGAPWFADVGVGSMSLTSSIRFELFTEQATPHEPRRIVFEDGRYFHQALLGDEWVDVYEFTTEEMPLIDREVANWYTSASPQSHFKNRLTVAKALPDARRMAIENDELRIRDSRTGVAQVTQIESNEQLLEILEEQFGLLFAAGTRFDWQK